MASALKRAMSGIGGMLFRSGRALLAPGGSPAAPGSGGRVLLAQPSGRALFGAPPAGAVPKSLDPMIDPGVAARSTPRASLGPMSSSRGRSFLLPAAEGEEEDGWEAEAAPLASPRQSRPPPIALEAEPEPDAVDEDEPVPPPRAPAVLQRGAPGAAKSSLRRMKSNRRRPPTRGTGALQLGVGEVEVQAVQQQVVKLRRVERVRGDAAFTQARATLSLGTLSSHSAHSAQGGGGLGGPGSDPGSDPGAAGGGAAYSFTAVVGRQTQRVATEKSTRLKLQSARAKLNMMRILSPAAGGGGTLGSPHISGARAAASGTLGSPHRRAEDGAAAAAASAAARDDERKAGPAALLAGPPTAPSPLAAAGAAALSAAVSAMAAGGGSGTLSASGRTPSRRMPARPLSVAVPSEPDGASAAAAGPNRTAGGSPSSQEPPRAAKPAGGKGPGPSLSPGAPSTARAPAMQEAAGSRPLLTSRPGGDGLSLASTNSIDSDGSGGPATAAIAAGGLVTVVPQ